TYRRDRAQSDQQRSRAREDERECSWRPRASQTVDAQLRESGRRELVRRAAEDRAQAIHRGRRRELRVRVSALFANGVADVIAASSHSTAPIPGSNRERDRATETRPAPDAGRDTHPAA